ncbi:MAG: DoxX family membrane protein [Bacteroidota bacterium]
MNYYNEIAVAFILRVFLGSLFLLQGYDKVFKIKIKGVYETFELPMRSKNMPNFILMLAAIFTSYTELLGGLFLILGLFKSFALYFLGIDLLLVAIAFGMLNPMWDMQFVFPRLVILVTLLLIPVEWDIISIDYLIKK